MVRRAAHRSPPPPRPPLPTHPRTRVRGPARDDRQRRRRRWTQRAATTANTTATTATTAAFKKKKNKKKTQKLRQQQRQQLRVAPVGFQFKKPHNRRSIEIEPLKAEAEACDRYLEDLDVYHQVFGEYPSSDEHPLPSCVVRYCDRLMALPVAERAQQCRTGVGSHPGFAIARLMVMDRCKAEFTESDAACERQRRLNMADAAAAARQAEEVGPNGETTLTHDRNTEVHKGAGKGQILKAGVWVKKQ